MNHPRPKPDAYLSNELRNRRFEIVGIIPPRPGSKLGTLILDDEAPIKSVTVSNYWLKATRACVGGRVSFVDSSCLRFHWEELDESV